jgi:CheY-like chemotaxis protein/HPt (histidine-containing phosphotransfer) domain-containing protein
LKIRLAEDNVINQKLATRLLEKLGHRVVLAGNGREALDALEAACFELVLMDVQMPEMDGLEATRAIAKRWPDAKRPRIIAMTGNALLGDREKCLEAGMDDYISKPVRIGELQAALERWAGRIIKRSDTAFLTQQGITADLLDQSLLEELRNMPADGSSMLKELIDLFLENAPQRIAQINHFLADPLKMAFHAHALKSMSLNLGANRIVEVCQKLEEMAHSGNEESTARLAQELERTFRKTQEELIPLRALEK